MVKEYDVIKRNIDSIFGRKRIERICLIKMMVILYDVDFCTINYHVKKYLEIVNYKKFQLSENFG